MKSSVSILLAIILSVTVVYYLFVFEKQPKSAEYYLKNAVERESLLVGCDSAGIDELFSNQNCLNALRTKSQIRQEKVMGSFKPSTHPGVPLNSY